MLLCTLYTYYFILPHITTIKPETLASGNFDEFGELGSNHQTLTFQIKSHQAK